MKRQKNTYSTLHDLAILNARLGKFRNTAALYGSDRFKSCTLKEGMAMLWRPRAYRYMTYLYLYQIASSSKKRLADSIMYAVSKLRLVQESFVFA